MVVPIGIGLLLLLLLLCVCVFGVFWGVGVCVVGVLLEVLRNLVLYSPK